MALVRVILISMIALDGILAFNSRIPYQAALRANQEDAHATAEVSRRQWIQESSIAALTLTVVGGITAPQSVHAFSYSELASDVTDKFFIDVKGLPSPEGEGFTTKRIVIGLFGKAAPQSTEKLKKLVSDEGLPAACKPKEERALQREQLEANKVFNSCIEGQDKGVNYDYAQIWRVIKGERIDFGSVAGRFVARQFPSWTETTPTSLKHDRPGLVSVRRGSDSGFGFTIYPGGQGDTRDLDENHIIVGQVIEGMDVIESLNNIPVVTSAKVNYMALTGGPKNTAAPSRACRYGGAMYCNENKPLVKLTIYKTGVV
jgi:cyclophilin family peptidyl-prolyl cis-trans isomerase